MIRDNPILNDAGEVVMWPSLDESHDVHPKGGFIQFGKTDDNKHLWQVGSDIIAGHRVSTVLLAVDHAFGVAPTLWFETMVFFREEGERIDGADEYCERYETWEQAKAGHETVCEALRNGVVPE